MAIRSPNPTLVLGDTEVDAQGTPSPMLPDNQLGLVQTPTESMIGEGGGDGRTPYYAPNQGDEVEQPGDEKSDAEELEEGENKEEVGEGENKEKEEQPPAPPLSVAAAEARLRRACTPNSKGEYKVPQQVIDQYLDVKGGRVDLMKLFERCGHDQDRAHASKQSCYTVYI